MVSRNLLGNTFRFFILISELTIFIRRKVIFKYRKG